MKRQTLQAAMKEAHRFIRLGNELLAASIADDAQPEVGYHYPKESGAVRRASMDLTRKLADLRQGQ